MEPHRGRGVLKVGLLLVAALLLAFGPAAAWACTLPDGTTTVQATVTGVLTETIERVDTVQTDDNEVHRVATAKEVGTVTAGCGTSLAALIGAIKVQPALSDVLVFSSSPNPALNTGPITGSVKFYPASGSGVVKAALTGTLDFTTAIVQRLPYVTISGEWTGTNSSLRGGVVGVALLPVAAADLGGACLAATGFCYVDVTGGLSGTAGTLVPLTIDEVQPAPSAKFVVTLFQ
jgi:hypothetical protein